MTARMEPQKRRSQQERVAASDHAMLKAAIKLVVRVGPRSMTLAQVGEESGYSGGLVTYRFGSKSGLLQAVSERILELWYERVLTPALTREPTPDVLVRLAKGYLDNVRKRSDLMVAQFRLMNASHSSLPELAPYFSEYDKRVRADIAIALEQLTESSSARHSVDPQAFAVAYVGLLRGVATQYFINNKAFDMNDVLAMVELICQRTLQT